MRPVHLFISLAIASLATAHDQAPSAPPDEAAIAYITKWKEVAIQKMKEHGIPASITLAQGLLESRSGQSTLTVEARNHFGIKCTPDWTGGKVYHDDDKKDDCFRKYKRDEDSFEDHSKFLQRPRYAPLFELKPTDYKGWARGLKKAGYATDPNYPDKLINLIERYELNKLDQGIDVSYATRAGTGQDKGGAGRKPHKGSDDLGTVTIGGGREVFLSDGKVKFVKAKGGETISRIAGELEQMPGWIAGWNDMGKDEPLEEGQIIYIQPKRNKAKHAEFHVAEEGETLWGISQRYGVKLNRLAKYNELGIASELKAGQRIWLRKPRN